MLIKNLLLVLISIFLFACNEEVGEVPNTYINEIKALTTNDLKKQYLENILVVDQSIRGDEDEELRAQYGRNSKEYRAYQEEQWRVDSINLNKIEKYFEVHGYPAKELGEDATLAPWLVIHHANSYDVRERNFEILYKAYLNGNINASLLSGFLKRLYFMKFLKDAYLTSPFIAENEVELLIGELELTDKKEKVLQEIKQKS